MFTIASSLPVDNEDDAFMINFYADIVAATASFVAAAAAHSITAAAKS